MTCPGPGSRKIETQTCLTGKPGILPRMTPRLLPGGFLEPASPPSPWAQSVGCRPYPSPLSSLLDLGCPFGLQSRVHAQQSFSAMWPCTRLLALRPAWGCHGNTLPRDCFTGPTSHWNVFKIPPFRPASKPPLPDGHSHHEQQENLFRLCPDFQFGKQMATIARPPCALYFPLPVHIALSFSAQYHVVVTSADRA